MYFKFTFKFTLIQFKFFFCFIKTNIVNLIYLLLIKTRFNIFMCFLLRTYFWVLLQEDLINYTARNRIVLLLHVKFISVCGIVNVVLSRPAFIILRKSLP